jgi:serine protease Do
MLTLAVVMAGSLLLGARLGLWGRGAGREPGARGVAGDPAAIGPGGSSAAEDAGARPGRTGLDEGGVNREKGPRAGASGPDLAGERDGGDAAGDGRRRAPGAEQVLAFLDEFERQIDAAMARARESVVALEYTAGHASASRRRIASGVVINAGGEILSVRIDQPRGDPPTGSGAAGKKGGDPERIVARDFQGRRHAARWLAADPHTGLTLLCVAPQAVRPIRPAANGPKLGGQVFVVGNPFGMGHSVNRGHVAGLDRVLELGERQLGGLIQVQAPIYPGDSGAAVVDVRGRWLGLIRGGLAIPGTGRPAPATDPGSSAPSPRAAERRDDAADVVDGEPDTDFGFAIPTRDALWIAEQLRAHGRVDRAYLGVRLERMPLFEGPVAAPEPTSSASAAGSTSGPSGAWRGAAVAGAPGPVDPAPEATTPKPAESDPAPAPVDGARIRDVVDGTPAAQAGLRPGDRIVSLDGQPIRSRNDLIDRLDRIPAGKRIVLGMFREGEPARPRFEVTVQTASRSGQPGPGPVAGQGTLPEPRSAGASVPVTPTASRAEPAAPATSPSSGASPAPSPSSGSNPAPSSSGGASPAPPTSGEARRGPGDAPSPSASPRQDAAPAPTPAAPDRSAPVPPAPGSPGSSNEAKLTLPRAVVERIEHLERRIDELEHVRAGAGTETATGAGNTGERDSRSQPAAPSRQREPAGRAPGSSTP